MTTEEMEVIIAHALELSRLNWEQEIEDWEDSHPQYVYLGQIKPISGGRFATRRKFFGEADNPNSYAETKGDITIPDEYSNAFLALEVELDDGAHGIILIGSEKRLLGWIGIARLSYIKKKFLSYCMYEK